mgnify:CR=1 FL=1
MPVRGKEKLTGKSDYPEDSQMADKETQPLEMMVQQIQAGMIKHFLTINRQGELVQLL